MSDSVREKQDSEKKGEESAAVGPVTNDSDSPTATVLEAAEAQPPPAYEEYVPDGGREAWTVVFGSALALFSSAGMVNAYVSIYFPRSPDSDVANHVEYRERSKATTRRRYYLHRLRRPYRSSGRCKSFSSISSAPSPVERLTLMEHR